MEEQVEEALVRMRTQIIMSRAFRVLKEVQAHQEVYLEYKVEELHLITTSQIQGEVVQHSMEHNKYLNMVEEQDLIIVAIKEEIRPFLRLDNTSMEQAVVLVVEQAHQEEEQQEVDFQAFQNTPTLVLLVVQDS